MNSAPWTGPATWTPSSVRPAIHLKYMPARSAAQLQASATARMRKARMTVLPGFMVISCRRFDARRLVGGSCGRGLGTGGPGARKNAPAGSAGTGAFHQLASAVGTGLVGIDALGNGELGAHRCDALGYGADLQLGQ